MRRFHDQDLTGAQFDRVSLRDAQMKAVDLTGSRMRGVELVDVEISGELQNVVVNGVDIASVLACGREGRVLGCGVPRWRTTQFASFQLVGEGRWGGVRVAVRPGSSRSRKRSSSAAPS